MLKFLHCMGLFFVFLVSALIEELIWNMSGTSFAELQRRRALRISWHSDRMLRLLGIRTQILKVPAKLPAGLIVCNHLSYIDVLVLSRAFPGLFITSVEVKRSLGLGQITRLAGCLFVERRNRAGLGDETASIAKTLRSGTSVVLFPEGTSTDGKEIRPFRPALFQAAIDARTPIHSFHVRYDSDQIPYYDDMEFLPHLRKLADSPSTLATLTYLGSIFPDENQGRKWLASESYATVLREHVSRV